MTTVLPTQPNPVAGQQSVPRALLEEVAAHPGLPVEMKAGLQAMLLAREERGIKKYGRSLETFNGRDMALDLQEELLDGLMYLTGLRLEQEALGAQMVACREILLGVMALASVTPEAGDLAVAAHKVLRGWVGRQS